MKTFLEKIWKRILLILVQAHIKRYKPLIIGITGSVGKTSTREAIKTVIGSKKHIRTAAGSLNNELGFALTILGNWDEEYFDRGSSFSLWLRVFFVGLFGLLFRNNSPEILVLEYGADRPGDIRKLVKIAKPHIGVITAVGEVPVHVEYFSGPEGVAKEKGQLIEALSVSDFAVLNFDDLVVLEMKEKTKAKVFTYGFGEGAMIRVSNFESQVENGIPEGVSFKINHNDSFVPFRLSDSLGKSQGYAAAAAAAVGSIFDMNLVDISEALSEYKGPKGRLKILKGIKNSVIIDDTYNASPISTHLALETLRDLSVSEAGLSHSRKVAILGDMLELGKYTIQIHQEIGNLAGSFVDLLICVGSRAKFIADSARRNFGEGWIERIFTFDTSDEAKLKVKELIKERDVVLVKGSQGIRTEKIVEEIMAEPDRKKELLVRQSQKWLEKQ